VPEDCIMHDAPCWNMVSRGRGGGVVARILRACAALQLLHAVHMEGAGEPPPSQGVEPMAGILWREGMTRGPCSVVVVVVVVPTCGG